MYRLHAGSLYEMAALQTHPWSARGREVVVGLVTMQGLLRSDAAARVAMATFEGCWQFNSNVLRQMVCTFFPSPSSRRACNQHRHDIDGFFLASTNEASARYSAA